MSENDLTLEKISLKTLELIIFCLINVKEQGPHKKFSMNASIRQAIFVQNCQISLYLFYNSPQWHSEIANCQFNISKILFLINLHGLRIRQCQRIKTALTLNSPFFIRNRAKWSFRLCYLDSTKKTESNELTRLVDSLLLLSRNQVHERLHINLVVLRVAHFAFLIWLLFSIWYFYYKKFS